MFYSNDLLFIRKWRFLVAILLWIIPIIIYGQSKPVIQVKFNMLEPNYVEFYNWDHSTGYIDSSAARILSSLLNTRFPFVTFIQGTADDQLIVSLDKHHEANPNSLTASVELSMAFKSRDGNIYPPIYETFREAGQALQGLPDDKDAFVLELQSTFSRWIKNKYDDILAKVCYNVKMCTTAHPLAEENSWVMPFSTLEMKIAERSNFRIETKRASASLPGICDYETTVQGNAHLQSLPSKYRGKMRCEFKADLMGGDCIENISNLEIQGIYLTKYQPLVMNELPPN